MCDYGCVYDGRLPPFNQATVGVVMTVEEEDATSWETLVVSAV